MAYERSCHLCKEPVTGRVAYTRLVEKKRKPPERLYACPDCFFQKVGEKDRANYAREVTMGAPRG